MEQRGGSRLGVRSVRRGRAGRRRRVRGCSGGAGFRVGSGGRSSWRRRARGARRPRGPRTSRSERRGRAPARPARRPTSATSAASTKRVAGVGLERGVEPEPGDAGAVGVEPRLGVEHVGQDCAAAIRRSAAGEAEEGSASSSRRAWTRLSSILDVVELRRRVREWGRRWAGIRRSPGTPSLSIPTNAIRISR